MNEAGKMESSYILGLNNFEWIKFKQIPHGRERDKQSAT